MNAVAEIERPTTTEIVALVEATPALVLTDKQKYSEFYEAMKAECDAHVPDLSTEKGRKAIASLAYKVARTKAAIDDAGKKLNEEARARINAIDESRRVIRQQLDTLKDDVRKPLTEWEAAEEKREALAAESLKIVREMGRVDIDDTVATVKARLDDLTSLKMNPDVHGATIGVAEAARTDAIAALQSAHERLVREEAERAELERLRAEAAERERQDHLKREAEDNLQAIHHVLEARRTEMRHGGLHVVRQTFKGFTALPAPADQRGWREVLGFRADERLAGVATIDARYRELATKAHPDKGGSASDMAELNRARAEGKAALS